jgi:GNAT superfamily N-acetyltransferase
VHAPVVDPLLDNPRSLGAKVAAVLGGTAVERSTLTGFLNSEFDPFLNQLFATRAIPLREAADALAGRPGFVWLAEPVEGGLVMHAMTAPTTAPTAPAQIDGEIVEVCSSSEVESWHRVYREVFGSDERGLHDWERIHDALGPAGDRSLVLVLALVNDAPAATGAVYFEPEVAGLYCFTTRGPMRGRGLGSALVQACHEAARVRGIERAVLQATASGRPVYLRAGYREQRTFPVLTRRR